MNESPSFEKAIQRLEEVVALLESGKCSLDESLALFDEGTKLVSRCTKTLQEAEQKILRLNEVIAEE